MTLPGLHQRRAGRATGRSNLPGLAKAALGGLLGVAEQRRLAATPGQFRRQRRLWLLATEGSAGPWREPVTLALMRAIETAAKRREDYPAWPPL